MAAKWSIQLLGSLQLHVGTDTIHTDQWVSKKAVGMLELLLASPNQQASRDRLVAILWPDEDRHSARGRLHSTVYFLRQALEPYGNNEPVIRYVSGTYSFQPAAQCTYDVDEFSTLYERAKTVEANDASAAHNIYLQAISMYAGQYLAHLPLQPWLAVQRGHFHDMYVQAIIKVATFLTANGDITEALRVLRTALARDPLHDQLHHAFMQSLLSVGRYAEAAQHFRAFAKQLHDTLGVAPSPALTQLMGSAASQDEQPLDMAAQHEASVIDTASFQYEVNAASKRYEVDGETASVVHIAFTDPVTLSHRKEFTHMLSRHVRRGDCVSWLSTSEVCILLPRTNSRRGPAIRARLQRLLGKARLGAATVHAVPIARYGHDTGPHYMQSVLRTS